MVEIPWHKLKFLCLRMEIDIIILADGQNAIQRRKPNCDRHKTSEFLQINGLAELGSELLIVRFAHQLREIDHSTRLFLGYFGFWIVSLFVILPSIAQVGKQI